ncbi:hypothetical protein HHE014_06150 [Helicobacter heilmannii]|nr:hypothetical protein HHE014_06150 [Helicobacter heilmannii]
MQVCRGTNESDKEYKRVGERGTTQTTTPLRLCLVGLLSMQFPKSRFSSYHIFLTMLKLI